ncbi:protein FAR1-RELATED SEQUENCE 5-like [Actinidia eriantha]|uniref:protein FAR1-RELATED SEQUENCE 5-like n=1 Tax=Actinidia eriantha TaxID=165200 RepID=UPI00258E6A6F|nr:protein FAR1-RELATED SEQUENCE 5-like [Actinidia eriantha]
MVYDLEDFDAEIYDEKEHIDELYGHEEHDGDDTEDRLEDLNMENEEIDVNNVEKPYVGMKFESDDDAYVFYNRYAKTMGFGVRKGGVRRSKKDGCVIGCHFFCSKEGFREERYKKNAAKKKKASRRY